MAVAIFIAVCVSIFSGTPSGRFLNLAQLSIFTFLQGDREIPSDVVVVGIDDETLKWLSPHALKSINRANIARVVKKLHEASSRAVMLDLVALPEEDGADEQLIDALKSGFSVIGHSHEFVNALGNQLMPQIVSDDRFQNAATMTIQWGAKTYTAKLNQNTLYGKWFSAITPFYVSDNIFVCEICLPAQSIENYNDALTPFTCAPLLEPLRKLRKPKDVDLISPSDGDYINFYGRFKGMNNDRHYLSMKSVLERSNAELEDLVKDKIVFLGFTAMLEETAWSGSDLLASQSRGGQAIELFSVPGFGEQMFGVEIHATIASNLLDRSWIRRMSMKTENNIMFFGVLIAVFVALRVTPFVGILSLIMNTAFWWIIAWIGFAKYHYFVPGAAIMTLLLMITMTVVLCFYRRLYLLVVRDYEHKLRLVFLKEWDLKTNRKRRLFVAFCASVVVVILSCEPYANYFNRILISAFYELREKIDPPSDVIVVGIDDSFIANYTYVDGNNQERRLSFKQPLFPEVLAKAINAINKGNPKLVVLDLLSDTDYLNNSDVSLSKAVSACPCVYVRDGKCSNDSGLFCAISDYDFGHFDYLLGLPNISFRAKSAIELKKAEFDYLINYYGPTGSIDNVFLHEIMQASDEELKKRFENKVVFLGYVTVMHRRELRRNLQHNIPGFGKTMFDVEIHATVAGNTIDGSWMRRFYSTKELLLIFAMSFIWFAIIALRRPVGALIVSIVSLITWFYLSYLSFSKLLIFIPGVLQYATVWIIVCAIVLLAENIRIRKIAKTKGDAFGITMITDLHSASNTPNLEL